VFPPALLADLRGELKWLQGITGDSRDLDVYVLEFDGLRAMLPDYLRADLDPLRGVLEHRRQAAHRAMVRELRGERVAAITSAWRELLSGLEQRPADDRPEASSPIDAVASYRIRKVYRRMLKMGQGIDPESPPEDYHELRKQGKELRYLLELFGQPLHHADVVKPMVKVLKGLQDVLGRHQDRDVQAHMLRSLGEEMAGLRGGAQALMAMGVLIERLEGDAEAARGEFADSFAQFASKHQRKLVKATFGR
jgi:CHAD domain-containing protein